jgi:hypothetical protein
MMTDLLGEAPTVVRAIPAGARRVALPATFLRRWTRDPHTVRS